MLKGLKLFQRTTEFRNVCESFPFHIVQKGRCSNAGLMTLEVENFELLVVVQESDKRTPGGLVDCHMPVHYYVTEDELA